MKLGLLNKALLALLVAMIALCPMAAYADELDLANDLAQAQLSAYAGGAYEDDSLAPSIHDENWSSPIRLQARRGLPSSYDSRAYGFVTPARDQDVFGTCWAFSTLAAIESSMLKSGLAADAQTLDLSERHLSYFCWHVQPDPLDNTTGDINTPHGSSFTTGDASDPYLGTGGSFALTSHALESWMGIVNETDAPTYKEMVSLFRSMGRVMDDAFVNRVALDASLSHSVNTARVSGIYRIAMSDQDEVKQAIVDHGAVGINIRWNGTRFNWEQNAFYNPASSPKDFGHMVQVVGWDDSFAAENFTNEEEGLTALPPGDGAWLAKNSWGSGWADEGFFWISYYDYNLQKSGAKAFTYEVSPAGDLDNIYQYDGTSGTCMNFVESGGSIANVFTVAANQGGSELLKSVSISLSDANVDYEVQVYTNIKDPSDPCSGDPALAQPITGKTTFAGFYTIDLPKPVLLAESSDFAVVFALSHADGSKIGYEVDCTYGYGDRYSTNNSWAHYTNHVERYQSFERNNSDEGWWDLSGGARDGDDEPSSCARIKAFTTNSSEEALAKPVWRRLFGQTALDTMRAILNADRVFSAKTVDTVVVASADDYRDALAATSLAGTYDAPVLITPKDALAAQTADELQRLHPSKVFVAGGEAALSVNVMADIRNALPYLSGNQVERVAGDDGVHTALKLYRTGEGWSDTAIIATSNSYKDALAIAPYAYAKHCPIILANPSKVAGGRVLHDDVFEAIVEGGFTRVIVTGGSLAVSDEVDSRLGDAGLEVIRLGGKTALDTSAKIATFEIGEGMTLAHMAVATTTSYKDALSGAALAGAQNSVLALVDKEDGYTAFDAAYLAGGGSLVHGHILGGNLAISKTSEEYFWSKLG